MNFNINMLCLLRQLVLLVILSMIGYTTQAACTYTTADAVTVTQATAPAASGTQYYYLFDCDGTLIAGAQTSNDFGTQAYGCYEIYALNSCPGPAPTGITTPADFAGLAAADYDVTAALPVTVCDDSDLEGCELEPSAITVVTEPGYNEANTQMYVLVCDGIVAGTDTPTPSHTSTALLIPDDMNATTAPSCEVYAVNYCPTGDASAIVAGASWAAVDPSADADFDVTAGAALSIPCTVPLPLDLITFDAICDNGRVDLEWITASEDNVKSIIVERAADGIRFEAIANIAPLGDGSPEQITYTYTDRTPLSEGYYRLKVLDFDGTYEYSDVRMATCLEDKFGFADIFPNPTKGGVTIKFEVADNNSLVTVKLVDVLGRVLNDVVVDPINGINTVEMDLTKLSAAMYMVILDDGVNQYTERIMKK